MKLYHRRRLPHYHPIGETFFITFRLKNSLSPKLIQQLQERYELDTMLGQKRYFKAFDEALHRSTNNTIQLDHPPLAQIIQKKLFQYDGTLYELIAFTIMSNHVHLLFSTATQLVDGLPSKNYKNLSEIMRLIKGGTAFQINRWLERKGGLWLHESYDHYVRDERSFENVVAYILNNPVKSGLVEDWRDYPFTYVKSA